MPSATHGLAFGVADVAGHARPHVVARAGSTVVDLYAAAAAGLPVGGVDPATLASPSLNALLGTGPDGWAAVRADAARLAAAPPGSLPPGVSHDPTELRMRLPVAVGDYVDGYGGIHHATHLGRLLRPGGDPLLPNWRHLPVAYHGRASTVVVSGTDVRRPRGQVPAGQGSVVRPTSMLDLELEVGYVVGRGNPDGEPIPADDAAEHLFGVVLLNDWSARDIQAFEYQPLGPFLGKSFATSVSAWVVPLAELRPHLVAGLPARQQPAPAAYLRTRHPWVPDLELSVELDTARMRAAGVEPTTISRVGFADAMYWSMAQQLAHLTVNGAVVRPGDLIGSGTASGADPRSEGGSLMEITERGEAPLDLPTGERRAFLEDGDRVTLRGRCRGGDGRPAVDLGEVTGTVRPALHGEG